MKRRRKNVPWFVYIVECANGTLYTGVTLDIERRLGEHNSQKGGHYTSAFGPVTLRWKEFQPDRSSALKREAQIKRWSRLEKLAFLARKNRPRSAGRRKTSR